MNTTSILHKSALYRSCFEVFLADTAELHQHTVLPQKLQVRCNCLPALWRHSCHMTWNKAHKVHFVCWQNAQPKVETYGEIWKINLVTSFPGTGWLMFWSRLIHIRMLEHSTSLSHWLKLLRFMACRSDSQNTLSTKQEEAGGFPAPWRGRWRALLAWCCSVYFDLLLDW